MNKTFRILWVEDDPAIITSGLAAFRREASLQKIGLNFDLAGSRESADEKLRSEEYHCILLDLSLPDSKCDETIDWITTLDDDCPPVIVLSNYVSPDGKDTTDDNEARSMSPYWRAIYNGAEATFRKQDALAQPAALLLCMRAEVLKRYRHAAKTAQAL